MDALTRSPRTRRSAVTPATVSRCGILPRLLLLCLCLSGCASRIPPIPAPTLTPTVAPSPTPNVVPPELLSTSWQLDYVMAGDERQPAFHEGQCLAIGTRPEEYYFYDGCNHGYCDVEARRSSVSEDDKTVICTLTLRGCPQVEPAPGTPFAQVEWDKPYHDALMGYQRVELRDGALWVRSGEDDLALVFRRIDGKCEAQDGYLRP